MSFSSPQPSALNIGTTFKKISRGDPARSRASTALARSLIGVFGVVRLSGRLMATELEPYEFVAAPPATTALLGYLVYGDHQSYQPVDGASSSHDTHLDEAVGIARAAQYFDIGSVEVLYRPYLAPTPTPRRIYS